MKRKPSTLDATKKSTETFSKDSIAGSVDGLFFSSKILAWYRKQDRPLPWRILWKKHRDPWHIWVSEIMLQQTLIQSVMPVYERFLKQYPSPKALAKASQDDVRLAVRGLGYYRRFDLLHRACQHLQIEKRALPTSLEAWLELPGVGPYTAAAITSITLDLPHGVVDGNVERVFCRLFDIRTEPNLPELKKRFKKIMDEICHMGSPGDVNQAVMELGQTLCTPSSPLCGKCPLKPICRSFAASSQAVAPAAKTKQPPIDVSLRLDICHTDSHVQLFLRPDDAKFLKGTWGFPTTRLHDAQWQSDGGVPINKKPAKRLRPKKIVTQTKRVDDELGATIGSIKHSITKHRIIADVRCFPARSTVPPSQVKRVAFVEVEKNLVSNLDRKAWNLFLKSERAVPSLFRG